MKGILRSGLVAVWLAALFGVGLLLPLPESVVRAQPPGSKPLADNTANPTVPGQASYNMCFDGTTWDRCASSTVSEGTHDTAAPGAPIGLFLMGKANDSTPTAVSTNDAVALRATTTGALVVSASQGAADTGGCLPYQYVAETGTNATNVKSTAGQVYQITVSNHAVDDRWLKLYALSSAPTVGTSVPIQTYVLKGYGTGTGWPALTVVFAPGLQLANGISFAIVAGGGVSEGGSIGVGEVVLSLCYR